MLRFAAAMSFALACGMSTASAQGDSTRWYDNIAVNGSASSSFCYNFNEPLSNRNQFHVFDHHHNSFTLDLAELIVQLPTVDPGDAGFRFDVVAGSSIPHVISSAGLLSGEDIDLKQSFVTWRVPGSSLRLDLGKFITHMGYEVIEGRDGINDNASRSFLFGYAIPFTHTGLRATYAFSDAAALALMVVNGWDNAIDNNKSKTLGLQFSLVPTDGLNVFVNGVHGPEQEGDNGNNRSVGDLVATWAVTDAFTLGINGDFGMEQEIALRVGADSSITAEDASWNGAALYARLKVADGFALAVRAEMFDDTDGVRTDVVQRLTEITLTPEYRPSNHIVIRADVRYDMSDVEAFRIDGGASDSQFLVGLNFFGLF